MSKAQMSIRMPYSLLDELNAYAEKTGLSKTEVVVRAIASYLYSQEDNSLEVRISHVEERLKNLENLTRITE